MSDAVMVIDRIQGATEQRVHGICQDNWHLVVANDAASARHLLIDQDLDVKVVVIGLDAVDAGDAVELIESSLRMTDPPVWVVIDDGGSSAETKERIDALDPFAILDPDVPLSRLGRAIRRALAESDRKQRSRSCDSDIAKRHRPEAFLGRSTAAAETRALLEKLASIPLSALLITGETGTGKGLAARIIHHSGPRRNKPLVEMNCAAIPADLLESELFGYEAGAFTGATGRRRGLLEQAHRGTLFLDEIAEMDLTHQTKLLKAIEEKCFRRLGGEREIQVDVQIIAATNRDLASQVQEGEFRADLYHRLNVFSLPLPPLRNRIEDLQDLVPPIIAHYNTQANKRVDRLEEKGWEKIMNYSWPGNVRELRNALERCVLLSEGDTLAQQWLQLGHDHLLSPGVSDSGFFIPLDGSCSLEEIEQRILNHALEKNSGNIAATARMLGTTRDTIRYRLTKTLQTYE